jgi:hypothetical protein
MMTTFAHCQRLEFRRLMCRGHQRYGKCQRVAADAAACGVALSSKPVAAAAHPRDYSTNIRRRRAIKTTAKTPNMAPEELAAQSISWEWRPGIER